MQKNTAGKWIVFAFQDEGGANPGEPVTGDAANITANIRIDGGAANAVDDTNPTELEDGYYVFDITAAESNGDLLLICPESATANVNVIGVPGAVWTMPANFNDLSVTETTGRVDVASIEGSDATDQINAACDTALADYDAVVPADLPTNFADLAITATTGLVAVGTNNDKSGYTISGTINTLDVLDGLQDDQHSVTRNAIAALPTAAENRAEMDSNSTQLAAILQDTAEIGTAGAGLTAIPWNSSWDAEVQSEVADALAAYNAVSTSDLPDNFSQLSIVSDGEEFPKFGVHVSTLQGFAQDSIFSACSDAVYEWTAVEQMEESYATAGTAPTMWQALFLIQQTLTDFSISGTSKTVRRLDGSTTAAVLTLDDDTSPTAITRSS